MKKPNRISMSLFDEELKALINASAKIFPITQNDVDTNNNPGGYEYGRVDNHIYRWYNDKWEYIIADDKDISWEEIKNKPTSYVPKEHTHSELHTHTNKSLLDTITESMVNLWNTIINKADKTYVDTELGKKSDTTHNHDAVYSKLNHTHDYSPTTHTHDDRYYTESEIDTKLLNKADSVHNHDGAYYKKSEVDSKLGGKANTSHKHSESDISDLDKYTTSEVDNLLSNKADVGHTHTELDIIDLDKYTKAEVDTKLAEKSNINHTHSDLHTHSNKSLLDKLKETQPNIEYDLSNLSYIEDIRNGYTEGHSHTNFDVLKGITAILVDGWNSAVNHISDAIKHITPAERTLWNTVSNKSDIGHTHNYADKVHQHEIDDINNLSLDWSSVENKPLTFPPDTHDHDDKYYTKEYIDTELNSKSNTTHIHDDRYYTESEIDVKLSSKADSTTLSGHTSNTTIHVTQTDKNNWNNKQDAIGYTPVNKAGDTMTGDLKVNGNIVAGTEYIIGYNGTSESLQRFKFKYNASTGYLELWRYSNDTGWTLCATFPNRNNGGGGLTIEGKQVAYKSDIPTKLSEFTKDINFDERYYTESEIDTKLANKANSSTLSEHTGNATIHVTQADKNNWNSKQDVIYLGVYTRQHSDTVDAYPLGISLVFVDAQTTGWMSYGSVMTVKGYSAGGGTFQLYFPYAVHLGGANVLIRTWEYGATTWSPWRVLGGGITIGTTKPTDGSMWYKVIG